MEREILLDNQKIRLLRVPYYSQSGTEFLCLVYSILMVFSFYKNIHIDPNIRNNSPNTTRDELISITKSDIYSGTTLSGLEDRLTQEYPNMIFELKNTSFDEIKKSLSTKRPVIVIYNPSLFLTGEKGPSHAGVVIGLTKDKIILNNPWIGEGVNIDRITFERSWEIEKYLGLYIFPNPQKRLIDEL